MVTTPSTESVPCHDVAATPHTGATHPLKVSAEDTKPRHNIKDYVDLIETVARVEYSRLPNHLIDYAELVNIGAIALHIMFTNNPTKEYNITYLSTAIKWAVRNELRNRYKWYAFKQADSSTDDTTGDDDGGMDDGGHTFARAAVYETILSVDSMMDADNPHEIRDYSATPEEHTEVREVARIVRECIARLPDRDREVVEARFYQNLKMREIGVQFGISPSRTSRVVQSALDKMKVELQKRGYTG
jgi:RNA polymerase sigma factor (sigma-70 family)